MQCPSIFIQRIFKSVVTYQEAEKNEFTTRASRSRKSGGECGRKKMNKEYVLSVYVRAHLRCVGCVCVCVCARKEIEREGR